MRIILTTILLLLSNLNYAASNERLPAFCEWLGSSATIIAQDRDNGIEEYDLIGKFLLENKSYGEQSVVIPLIDRVYGIERNISSDSITYIEQQRCEIAFVQLAN